MTQQVKHDLSVLNFILALKTLDFQPEYERDPSGIIVSSTNNGILTWGEGKTYEHSRADLMSALRTWSEIYFEDFAKWYSQSPEDFPYALKVMLSSDEELAQCLSGKITKDF